jgi:hypothetical protein
MDGIVGIVGIVEIRSAKKRVFLEEYALFAQTGGGRAAVERR